MVGHRPFEFAAFGAPGHPERRDPGRAGDVGPQGRGDPPLDRGRDAGRVGAGFEPDADRIDPSFAPVGQGGGLLRGEEHRVLVRPRQTLGEADDPHGADDPADVHRHGAADLGAGDPGECRVEHDLSASTRRRAGDDLDGGQFGTGPGVAELGGLRLGHERLAVAGDQLRREGQFGNGPGDAGDARHRPDGVGREHARIAGGDHLRRREAFHRGPGPRHGLLNHDEGGQQGRSDGGHDERAHQHPELPAQHAPRDASHRRPTRDVIVSATPRAVGASTVSAIRPSTRKITRSA